MPIRFEFVAWHSVRPLSAADVEHRLAAVEAFYPHTSEKRFVKTGVGGHTGLIVWAPQTHGLSQWCGPSDQALVYASHCPFGISKHVEISGPCAPDHVRQLHDKVRAQPETMRTMVPPLALAQLSNDGGLHIHADIRGFSELYHHRNRQGLQVWSSRLAMPLVFALEQPVESRIGAQLRAVFTFYPHHHTPFDNVTRLLGGASVYAGDWPAEPISSRRNHLLDMLGQAYGQQGAPVDYAACQEAMSGMLSEVRLFWSSDARSKLGCGLTGGRDSRTILSTLIATGQSKDIKFSTKKLMRQDYEVVPKLVGLCGREGHPLVWQMRERPPSAYCASNDARAWAIFPAALDNSTPDASLTTRKLPLTGWLRRQPATRPYVFSANPLLDRMTFHFHDMDGQVMPTKYYASPQRQGVGTESLMLGGMSGEILRGVGYGTAHLAAGPDQHRSSVAADRFQLGWRRLAAGKTQKARPYLREVHVAAHAAWSHYLDEARDGGIGGFLIFDYMNVVAQQSRRVEVPKMLKLISPLALPILLTESYKLSAEQRVANAFPIGMIGAAAPFLLEAPFSHQMPKDEAEIRLNATGFPQFWDANAVPGFHDILAQPDSWNDTFVEPRVLAEFDPNTVSGHNAAQRDRTGGLLLWRAAQKSYCEILGRHIAQHRRLGRMAA